MAPILDLLRVTDSYGKSGALAPLYNLAGTYMFVTAKGFVFMLLEDEFGMANVVVKPQLYQRYRNLVRAEPFVLVSGELQRRDGTTNVIADGLLVVRAPCSLTTPPAHTFG